MILKNKSIFRLISSCILFSSTLLTGTTAIANDVFSGFYLGASAGGSFLSGYEDGSLSTTLSGIGSLTATSRYSLNKNSYFGTAYIGYGNFLSCQPNVFLGTELFVDVANRNDTIFSNSDLFGSPLFTSSTRVNVHPVSWGLDIRPGYRICDALLYTRLGMGLHRITLTHNTRDIFVGAPLFGTSNSKTIDRATLRLGLGFEYPICDYLTLRADYIYTYIGKTTVTDENSRQLVIGEIPRTQKTASRSQVTLCNNAVMLGLAWHW